MRMYATLLLLVTSLGTASLPALGQAATPWTQPAAGPLTAPSSRPLSPGPYPTAVPTSQATADPTAIDIPVPTASPLVLPPGSCAELADLTGRLACLKTRIQRQEADLLPDVMAFLATSPQTADPPLAWLQALSQPPLLKQLAASLKGLTQPVVRQHLLLLFQYTLISHPEMLDAITRAQVFDNIRPWLTHPHVLTRLQALDLWLMHHKAEALPQLNQLLASPLVNERVLGLVHYGRWLADPALKKLLPPIPGQTFLAWTQQPNQSISELKIWTFHGIFRNGATPPDSYHAFLGQWLDASPPDTIKLAENALLLLLRHEHPALRAYALKRLALTGNPAYAARLEALFSDPDPAVRLRAQEALTQLQKMVPLQYLESLKDPNHLPPDTPDRIRSLMRNPETRARLLEPVYKHLARQPVFLEELWTLLQTSTDPVLLRKGLQALQAAPANWSLQRMTPLLEASQDVHVRAAALALMLQRPYTPELGEMLRPLLRDPQIELPLEILNYLFRLGAFADTRNLLFLLAAKADQRVDRSLLSFDGAPSSAPFDDYVADRLDDWILATDSQGRTLVDWLVWIRDPNLPSPWRRAILRLISSKGRRPELLPLLRQLVQDPDLGFDAEFALNAVESRVDAGW